MVKTMSNDTDKDALMLTLAEFNERMKPMYAKMAECEVEFLEQWKKDCAFWGWKPPTRWQRIRCRLRRLRRWIGCKIGGIE